MGGNNPNKLFLHIEEILNSKPKNTLAIREVEIKSNEYKSKLNEFINKLK
jgi:hypothetical protein